MVEAAYRLDLSASSFNENLAEALLPLRGEGFGVFAYDFGIVDDALTLENIAAAGVPSEIEHLGRDRTWPRHSPRPSPRRPRPAPSSRARLA